MKNKNNRNKKTFLQAIGGVIGSSVMISAFVAQPSGSLKQAKTQYEDSLNGNVIRESSVGGLGTSATPHLTKAINNARQGDVTLSSSPFSPSIPDYVSDGHQTVAYDTDGNEFDVITQEQSVSKEITLSNGETYTEMYGFKDDQGNYMDELPADAAVGVENTPAYGNGDGMIYEKYTSRDNVTLTFSSKVSSSASHGRVNTQSVNGPTIVYDASRGSWHSVSTGTTSGKVGDGSGGNWTHSKTAAGSTWPRSGFNPPSGTWGYSTIRDYGLALYDWYITNSSSYSGWTITTNTYNWLHGVGIGSSYGVSNTYITRTEMSSLLQRAWSVGYVRNVFHYFIFNMSSGSGFAGNSPNMSGIRTMYGAVNLHETGTNFFGGQYGGGNISNVSGSNGSWEYYAGNRENEWVYSGPIFYSSNPTGYSGSTTIYSGTYAWSTNSTGSTIYDQNKKIYPSLPVNAEKHAVLGYNGPGVGDESGNTYYQGTLTPSTTRYINNAFTADAKPGWIEDELNTVAVGDGSGLTYERALYYYDADGNIIHDLPDSEFLYTGDSGNLFNTVSKGSTYTTSQDRFEGNGIAQTLKWVADNQDSLTLKTENIEQSINVDFVVTETDTKQKRLLIAIQAAIAFLAGSSTQTELNSNLALFQTIVDISDAEIATISSYANTVSSTTITSKLQEGHRQNKVDYFGESVEIFGTVTNINTIKSLLDGDDLKDWFAISSGLEVYTINTSSGTQYVYREATGTTAAQAQIADMDVTMYVDPKNALLQSELNNSNADVNDWGLPLDGRASVTYVRYTDFDYDKNEMSVDVYITLGNETKVVQRLLTFENSYMDKMMNELAIDQLVASADMLAEQPLLTTAEYSVGNEDDVNANTASFALQDTFQTKFPDEVKLLSVVQLSPPTEEQLDVEYQFTIEYEGHQRTFNQFFTFAKTRSQKYVEDAVVAYPVLDSVVSVYDKTIIHLTSREVTFQPFEDFLVADGNTSSRMTFANIQLVGGGIDINGDDRDLDLIDFTVDITLGGYTLVGQVFTLDLNKSINQELTDNLTEDEIIHTTPGIATIVDDLLDEHWNDSKWWTIQSSWIEMLDIAGIAIVGNFRKIDERNFSVDLEVTIGNSNKVITVTQQVGFNLNFASVLNEATTGISDPDMLEALRVYMLNFNEQASVFYIGTFGHAFDAVNATTAELLQAWEGTISTLAGDAVLRSVELTDKDGVTKYDRDVSFRITLEDSRGNTRVFNKVYRFDASPVALQFDAAVATMLDTTRTLSGQLTDSVLTMMTDINDYSWLNEQLGLLDTLRVVSATNTGKTAHVVFEFGYSGHLGSDSKQVSIDYVFDRRADKDAALLAFGLGYTEAELAVYYDPDNVDSFGNDWKNVEQIVLDELIKISAQKLLRDHMYDEMTAEHSSIFPNVWATQVDLETAIDEITTTTHMTALQAEIIAGGVTRTSFITNEWTQMRNDRMEEMILSDFASNWKLNSITEAIAEITKYNTSFDVKDYYLADVVTVVENASFDVDISLEIAHQTLMPHVLSTALNGTSSAIDPLYYAAVDNATTTYFVAEYANNITGGWTNIDEFIISISDAISQIIIDDQIFASTGIINSTTHFNDRTINELVKDLTVFTDEQIKIVGYDVENAAALDRDSNSFSIEVFLTFGSVVNQRHVLVLDLDKSVNQAILDEIQATDISIKDFFSHELASELELSDYDQWDKFGLSSTHILQSDNMISTVDASSFNIVGDQATSPNFSLSFTFQIGNTTRTITSQQRTGVNVVFDLDTIDPADTELIAYLRGYDVAEKIDYQGTWLHPHEILDATDQEVNDVLVMYSGLIASGVQINSIAVHNRAGISQFDKTITLKIIAEDINGFIKEFDKVITFNMSAAEWSFAQFDETSVQLKNPSITSGMLTDAIRDNILADRTWYDIVNARDLLHIDNPTVKHSGKTATVSWRVWYDDGQPGGASNSKVVEIDYEFASRGSKDDAMTNFGLQYDDGVLGLNIDWTNVDGTNDWTNVEQNILDELVRAAAELAIREEVKQFIISDAIEYTSNVWTSEADLEADIFAQTDVDILSTLADDINNNRTTRNSFIQTLKSELQVKEIEELILTTMQTRWAQSSVENLLNLIAQFNSLIDVKNYYQHDMHGVIAVSTFAEDISRQMELDAVRNNVAGLITVGLNPSDSRYTIYTDVMNAKLDTVYDTEQSAGFPDVNTLIRTVANGISQEAIDDLLATINDKIDGTVDEDTRVLGDIFMNMGGFDQAGILHSNIAVAGGADLDYDLQDISLTMDLIWGSVTNYAKAITLSLNETISTSIIEAIRYDEIGLIDPRLAPTADQVDTSTLTDDMFDVFSGHILSSDVFGMTIDTSTFTADPIEPRDFTMDVTITVGSETRVITILASVGFDIFLDWKNIDLGTATDAEKDIIDFMDSYDFQKETEFLGIHSNPWALRDETHLFDQFTASRNLQSASGSFTNVVIKDASSITKYDREMTVIITVIDKHGVEYDFEKVMVFGESYLETLTKNTNNSHFDIQSSIDLADMLTDETIADMGSISAYDVDSMLSEFDVIEVLSLSQSGKTATATFRVSYDNGTGHSGSKILTREFIFASRGSRTQAVDDFSLGYTDTWLGIDWDSVDAIGNDWTNVEQSTLDQLVMSSAYNKVREETRNAIIFDSTGYVDNVFGSASNIDVAVLDYADNTELAKLQQLISSNIMTRNEWMTETKLHLQTTNVERMILEALSNDWKLLDSASALEKAKELKSGFDISSYYSNMNGLVLNPTFDTDQSKQIGYDVFFSITRDLMNIFHSTVDSARDTHFDNVHANLFEAKYDETLSGAWSQLNEFEKLISDGISRQFLDDEIAKINVSSTGYPTILGFVDMNTRMLNDVAIDFSALEAQFIDISNIRLTSNGTTLGGDLTFEQIFAGLSFGSVVVDDATFTLEFDQTINYAIMEAIDASDIRMTEYRTSETTDKVNPADILAWMFTPLASHLRASDSVVVGLDASNPFTPLDATVDPYLRRYSIGITLTLGNETRTYHVTEKLGQLIVFGDIDSSRWTELEIIDADDEADFIAYNDSYPYVESIKYQEDFNHVLDIQSATETEWAAALLPSLYVTGGGMTIDRVVLKNNGTYDEFDKEFTFILTLADQWGDTKVVEKTITLANSAVEYALLQASDSSFDFIHHDNTTAMLTDDTLANVLTDKASFFIDADISQYLDISDPIVEYRGKTATVSFHISYNNGSGYADSRVIQIDIIFASRGSKDEAMANFSLGYTDSRLGIDWNTVDAFANDWTNVEQEVLDNLVKLAAQSTIRNDVNDNIIADASEYISNVWSSQLELSGYVDDETTQALLALLQAEILAGNTTRAEFVTNLIYILKTEKIEALLYENMASLWRIPDASLIETVASGIKSDFDIKDYYYSNMDGIIKSADFVDTITYKSFANIYLADINTSMLSSSLDKDKALVSASVTRYVEEKMREVFALNVWTNDSTIVSHTSHLISEQAIQDALDTIISGTTSNSTVTGQVTRDLRNIKDMVIEWSPLTASGLYLSNIQLHGSTDGEFVDRDATTLPSSIAITFGTIIDTQYLIDVEVDQSLNEAIINSLTQTSVTLKNAKRYADVDFMLNAMNEPATITNAAYFESNVDYMTDEDATIAIDPANPLTRDPDSGRIFRIGLIITAGSEVRSLEIVVQVGESIDFSLPEFGEGGTFDFTDYFVTTTDRYDNPYDLHRIGDEAKNHIGIDAFLDSSFVTVESIEINANGAVDIFSRRFVATFVLVDKQGNKRTFVDQPIVIPGALNKAESIMASIDQSQVQLSDLNLLNGQLTDDVLANTLTDLDTYLFGNDIDLLNNIEIVTPTNTGKFAEVTFYLGYDDGNGVTDSVEYNFVYEFAYRADVQESLDYYGLGMSVDQLYIQFSEDQASGNVEQEVIDDIVKAALQQFLTQRYVADLQSFIDAEIFERWEVEISISDFIDLDKVEEIAAGGQSTSRDEVLNKVKAELINKFVTLGYDKVAQSFLKANDWRDVWSDYPTVTNAVENAISENISNNTFDAAQIITLLGYEMATAVADDVRHIAENGDSSNNLDAWLLQLIGEEKNGFLWTEHSTILEQLRSGFNDAPTLSSATSSIHVNENSDNGWFIDEIDELTDFSQIGDYIAHLSTKIARVEIPAEITDAHLKTARESFINNMSPEVQILIDEGVLTIDDIEDYLKVLLFVEHDHPQGYPEANFDAIFSSNNYYQNNKDQMIVDMFTIVGNLRANEAGASNASILLRKTAIYINVIDPTLEVASNDALFDKSETIDEFRDLHNHYVFMMMNNVYEEAYSIYRSNNNGNAAATMEQFLMIYVTKMDVHLSVLEGIDYSDQDNLDSHAALIAMRVVQIQDMPDIQGIIDIYINNIGLIQAEVDDAPYKDLNQFTVTQEELEVHLFDQAMILILQPGGMFDQVVDQFTNRPSDITLDAARELLHELMTQAYPVDEPDLELTIKAAILFANLNESYYQEIVAIYYSKVAGQNPEWNAETNTVEARAAMTPVIDRVFAGIKDGSLDLDTAAIELEDSKEEVAVSLSWMKYEEVFMDILDSLADQDEQIDRITLEEFEEYATDKLDKASLSFFIQEYLDIDKAAANNLEVPETSKILSYVEDLISETVLYAQERFDTLLDQIAEATKLTRQDVIDQSSIMTDTNELDVRGDISTGGTSTEIKALRAEFGRYVFELLIEVSDKPDPVQSLNGWLIPFAAMITKTEDYSKITEVIQDKIDAGEDIDFENWGFDNVADIMDALIDTSEDQETYNAATGKILMDKFIRTTDSSSNKWSTTMWMGPVPLRMTYGTNGDIASMQTILMDREDPESIKSIGLSTIYDQKEMTLRLGMEDGTTVYVRYVEDSEGHINVILERIDAEGIWLTSEMYREQNSTSSISKKGYDIFRDTNMESFNGLESEFEDGMITIFGTWESSINVNSSINQTNSTIDHVWGTNPVVDEATDTGSADAAKAVVTKDANGNTHIQMHMKDLRITNTTASISAVITAGGFTLMWLWWTFVGGLASLGTTSAGIFGFVMTKKERKRRFVKEYPQYEGASTKKVLKLEKLLKAQTELTWEFNHGQIMEKDVKEIMHAKLKTLDEQVNNLRILVLAEAEAAKFAKGFRSDIKILESARMTYENIDSAAHSSMSLKKVTAEADKLIRSMSKQDLTREFKMKYLNKPIKNSKKLDDSKAAITLPKKEVTEAKVKTPRELLKEIKSLKTSAKIPTIDKPLAGINVEPITKLGFEVESAIFKRAEIDKNSKVQTLSMVLILDDKEVSKDVKVSYKSSVNAEIIKNLSRYTIDANGLGKYGSTSNSEFTEANIQKAFSINAPGTKIEIVKGSLVIVDEKTFSVTLKITVGKSSTTMSFKSSI